MVWELRAFAVLIGIGFVLGVIVGLCTYEKAGEQ